MVKRKDRVKNLAHFGLMERTGAKSLPSCQPLSWEDLYSPREALTLEYEGVGRLQPGVRWTRLKLARTSGSAHFAHWFWLAQRTLASPFPESFGHLHATVSPVLHCLLWGRGEGGPVWSVLL